MRSLRTSLGRSIRALRSAAGFSQEGFADAIGMHRTYMGTLERGATNPSLDTLERVARGLRLSVSELLRHAEAGAGAAEYGRAPKAGRAPLVRRVAEPDKRR